MRAAIEPERQAPPRPLPPRRAATDPYLGDDRPAPTGRQIEVAGKPATRGSFDPTTIGTDADAFQFKGGGDSAGVTERLQGVTRWDPMASGNVVLFERADGTRVIADGHQRLGLARRIARDDPDQNVRLDGYLFREVDGWTPSDVRVVAAKKNLQEGSGDAIDAARVIREAPDVLDASVPVSSEQMRQARQLARLSDEAFGMVVGGVVPANHAAALGEAQVAPHRHVGILSELAQVGPSNVREARLLVAELAQMPANAETQMTLLGAETTVRPLLRERVKVLDAAMQRLRADTRLFGMLTREAQRIAGAGNRLDGDANTAARDGAAQVLELVDALARQRGPVSDMLNAAAEAVADGTPARTAAEAFAARVSRTFREGGLDALTRSEPAPSLGPGGRFDSPADADAEAQ
ncbi:MAG: hypothetical protein AAGJ36_09665, partial [Pseudomonadota bacterium]